MYPTLRILFWGASAIRNFAVQCVTSTGFRLSSFDLIPSIGINTPTDVHECVALLFTKLAVCGASWKLGTVQYVRVHLGEHFDSLQVAHAQWGIV